MSMKKYQVIKAFKGSPNGAVTLSFEKEQELDHSELGDGLVAVALKEKWIKEVEEKNSSDLGTDPEQNQE